MPNTIEIFWAPNKFTSIEPGWNLEYQEPKKVYAKLRSADKNSEILRCPAFRDAATNLYAVEATFGDKHKFRDGLLPEIATNPDKDLRFGGDGGRIALIKVRDSALAGYINVIYNLAFSFFASEPVLAKFTAPYFPVVGPTKNSYLAIGEFDIGRWFRPYNLDYHIPLATRTFEIAKGDPLFFMDLKTDKKIKFRRFMFTEEIRSLSEEAVNSSGRYPRISLVERYEMAHRSKMIAQLRKLIMEAAVE